MTIPSFLLSPVIACLLGAVFHLWRNGGLGRLLLYLILSLAGFFAGDGFGNWRGWIFLPVGTINLGMAVIGSLVFLGVGDWLSLINIRRPSDPDDAV